MKPGTAVRAAGLAVLCAAAAACGGGEGAGGEPKAQGGAGAAAAGGADGRITVAVIAKSSNNPVFLAARTGAEAAAKAISAQPGGPQVEIAWLTPPQEDGQVQAQRIQQAVNDGADAILISASDAGKVAGAIDDAVGRGVEVMTFDSDVPQSRRFAYYGVDDVQVGRTVMAELAAQMNGQGSVAILAGNQNAPNLQRRAQGVREEAAKHPGIKVVDVFNHIETPQDAAAEVIRVNNAYPERGIAPVLVAQPVYQWGYVGVKTIVDKLQGKQVPQTIPMEPVKVTRQNLGEWARQLRSWGFTDVDPAYLKL
jgi:ribose transport system substrate-binding protein